MAKKLSREQEQKQKAEKRRKEEAAGRNEPWRLPLLACSVNKEWLVTRDNLTLVVVTIFRKLGDKVLMGSYLVDLSGRGVKNAFVQEHPSLASAFYALSEHPDAPAQADIEIDLACAIIQAGMRVANSLGISPDPDFRQASKMLPPDFMQKNFGIEIKTGSSDGRPMIIGDMHSMEDDEFEDDGDDEDEDEAITLPPASHPDFAWDEKLYGPVEWASLPSYATHLVNKIAEVRGASWHSAEAEAFLVFVGFCVCSVHITPDNLDADSLQTLCTGIFLSEDLSPARKAMIFQEMSTFFTMLRVFYGKDTAELVTLVEREARMTGFLVVEAQSGGQQSVRDAEAGRIGPAEMIVRMAKEAGIDIRDQKAMDKIVAEYNRRYARK